MNGSAAGRTTTRAFARGMRLLLAAAIIALLSNAPPAAHAQSAGDASQRELRIERSLACPQCTDLPLDVCDQDICNDMRAIIHQKVGAGESDAAIRKYFVQRYGTRVLLAPPTDSFGFLVWILPFAALAIGAGLTIAYLRSAQAKRTEPGTMTVALDEAADGARYRARVEREVGELE